MSRRVGGAISCVAWLLLGCGKSEHSASTTDGGRAGSETSGGFTSRGGAGPTGGTGGEIAAGGHPTMGGSATTMGGSAASSGGPAEGGAPEMGGEPSGGATGCDGSYLACGCGCCGGQDAPLTCVYPELGQTLTSIMAADLARRHDTAGCASAGCSRGIDYVCCEAPTPSAEQATYMASLFIGDIGRIHIDKVATPDCSRLTLRQHNPSDPAPPGFALETPAGWEIEEGLRAPCSSSMTRPRAIGAIGGLSLHMLGDACVADVHLVLFFGDVASGVDAERFDADALPVGLSMTECH